MPRMPVLFWQELVRGNCDNTPAPQRGRVPKADAFGASSDLARVGHFRNGPCAIFLALS